MRPEILMEIEALRRATLAQLRERYRELFGEDAHSRHREHLFRKVAWRLQALDQGGLTERARARAAEIAADADLRVVAPRGFFGKEERARLTVPHHNGRSGREDRRVPIAGTLLEREFRGRKHLVEVLPDGFRYEGRHHRSLSSVAREITGTRWNGMAFFNLTTNAAPGKQKKERSHGRA